jgi:general secretion pathway protein D
MGGMGGMGGSSGYGGYGQSYGGGINPMAAAVTPAGAAGAAGARSAFANRLGNIIRSGASGAGGAGEIEVIGMTKIIADERTNSLLIFADKQDMQMITNIISKLDIVLAQVLIEGVVAEVALGKDFHASISAVQRQPSQSGDFSGIGAVNPGTLINKAAFASQGLQTNSSSPLQGGFTYVMSLGGDLDLVVAALASDSHAQIMQRPRIITSHAKEASIFIGQTRPYITGYTAGGGYYGNYSQYQQLQIGINLSILPFINSEGLVVMDIRQRIQNVAGSVTINGNDVPITSDKEASAYIAVRDRDTVMLGGYIDSDISSSHEGVPWLMDIPLIGVLFKSHSTKNARTETVLLVRPTVLNTPEAAATATALERDNMPALRDADIKYERQTRQEAEAFKAQQEQEQMQDQKAAKKKNKTAPPKQTY